MFNNDQSRNHVICQQNLLLKILQPRRLKKSRSLMSPHIPLLVWHQTSQVPQGLPQAKLPSYLLSWPKVTHQVLLHVGLYYLISKSHVPWCLLMPPPLLLHVPQGLLDVPLQGTTFLDQDSPSRNQGNLKAFHKTLFLRPHPQLNLPRGNFLQRVTIPRIWGQRFQGWISQSRTLFSAIKDLRTLTSKTASLVLPPLLLVTLLLWRILRQGRRMMKWKTSAPKNYKESYKVNDALTHERKRKCAPLMGHTD